METVDSPTVEGPKNSRARISVHVLAAFVFCRRAGLLAFESQQEDDGHDLGLARLDFTYAYGLVDLQNELSYLLNWLGTCSAALVIVHACQWVVSDILLDFGFILLQLAIVSFLVQLGWKSYVAYRKMHKYAAMPAQTPDPASSLDEKVNWWSMQSAGFEAILPPEAFYDPDSKLTGKPWRLLRHGNTLIPVFRSNKPNNIKPQHRARVAAYCRLIANCEGSQSPYGIVLNPNGYTGTAIKITERLQDTLTAELARARQAIVQATQSATHDPRSPSNEKKCESCPYGKMYSGHDSIHLNVRGEPSLPHSLKAPNGQAFHSHCGDRFQWWPPHKTQLEQRWTLDRDDSSFTLID